MQNSLKKIFVNWVCPGYYLRNLLFNRYDLIRMKDVKPYKYVDPSEAVLFANMQIIVDFMEKEGHYLVDWYDKESSPIYGKNGEDICFPEYKGKFMMDIIKEIYNWWKIEHPKLEKHRSDLLHYSFGFKRFYLKKQDDDYKIEFLEKNPVFEEFKEEIEIAKNYLNDEEIYDSKKIEETVLKIEKEISNKKRKYLILIVEIRECLWV